MARRQPLAEDGRPPADPESSRRGARKGTSDTQGTVCPHLSVFRSKYSNLFHGAEICNIFSSKKSYDYIGATGRFFPRGPGRRYTLVFVSEMFYRTL